MLPLRHLLFLFLIVVIGLPACGPSPSSEESPVPEIDSVTAAYEPPESELRHLLRSDEPQGPAPDFELPMLENDTFRLSEHRGKVILLNFWATWCPPCIEEMPALAALHEELDEYGFSVVGVALDAEGEQVVKPFVDERQIPYPILLDDGTVAEAFGGVLGLPTTFLIDQEGEIVQRITGIYPVEEMRSELRAMVDAPQDAGTAQP